ncbi:hypothetical protein COS75_00535 [Candidatus Pacearchaeota archaeon CG06_land_8_20_14_3_00_35_12]|nr:MAG: hypothetical protein COS75_00535 [Candidatus Pacearchaeota archaeon CG06_land_8_20_14_3_00_35_12]
MAGQKGALLGNLVLRYVLLLLIPLLSFAFFNNFLAIFYFVFKPLTVWPVVLLLKLFYPISFLGNYLTVSGFRLEIIDACIAGSAYFLLFILNLTTANIPWKKRIKIFSFDAILLLAMNIVRIIVLAIIGLNMSSSSFDITHKFFWYGISTIYVVFIWLLTVFIFKLREIPIYSDIKVLLYNIKHK